MAVFLKLEGIQGESQDKRHADEIDVLAWSLGLTNPSSPHTGGGAGSGRVSFSDLAVTKAVDRATPALMLAVASGRHHSFATLTVTSGGPRPVEYLVLELEDVLVTSCLLADTAEPDRPVENVSLAYGKVHVAYTRQSSSGGVGSVSEMTWDLVQNTGS